MIYFEEEVKKALVGAGRVIVGAGRALLAGAIAAFNYCDLKYKTKKANAVALAMEKASAQIQSEMGGSVRGAVAEVLSESFTNADMKGVKSTIIKATYLYSKDTNQYWSFELPVTRSVAVLCGNCSEETDYVNRIFKNKRSDMHRAFVEKMAILGNDEMPAYRKNQTWAQYYEQNFMYLKDWFLTDMSIKEGTLSGNIVISETSEVQQFSPQQVYWVDAAPPQAP